DDAPCSRAGLRHELGFDPGQAGVAVVAKEMTEFHRTLVQLEGDDDFEVAVWPAAVAGLDEAAGAGGVVGGAGDAGAAELGRAGVGAVAVEVPEFDADAVWGAGDDDFEVAVWPAAVAGLDEAAGAGGVVGGAGDAGAADPGQVGVGVVAVEVPEFDGAA